MTRLLGMSRREFLPDLDWGPKARGNVRLRPATELRPRGPIHGAWLPTDTRPIDDGEGCEMTLADIGEIEMALGRGGSSERIRQIEGRALHKLFKYFSAHGFTVRDFFDTGRR